MGLFDKKKSAAPPLGHSQAFVDILSSGIGPAQQWQSAFGEQIGQEDWSVDFNGGVILFGEREFPIGFVGTESHSGGTWMWGSHNINGFPEPLVHDVTAFVHSPEVQAVAEICRESFALTELICGHHLSSILAARLRCCYYRCGYNGGAAFVLVKEVPEGVFAPTTAQRIATAIGELTMQLPLNHRLLAESLLRANDMQVDVARGTLTGRGPNGWLKIAFDSLGRIRSLNAGG